MSHTLRICLTLACLALCCAGHLRAQAAAKPAASATPEASPTASPTPSPTPVPLPDVVAEANNTARTLRDVGTSLASDEVRTKILDELPTLTRDIDARTAETNKVLAGSPSLEMLGELDKEWQSLHDTAQGWSRDLVRRATELDAQLAQLTRLADTWRVTAVNAKSANLPPETSAQIDTVMGSIQPTRDDLENRRAEILSLQSRLATQENRIETAKGLIRQAREQATGRLLERGSAPIWQLGQAGEPGSDLAQAGETTFSAQASTMSGYLQRQPGGFLIHAGIITLLVFALRWARRGIRRWVEQDAGLQRSIPVFEVPISAAIALSALLIGVIYPQAPRVLRACLGAVVLIPTVILLGRLVDRRHFPILYASVSFWFVDELRLVTASLPAVARWLLAMEALAGLVFAVWLLRNERLAAASKEKKRPLHPPEPIQLYTRVALPCLAAALVANVLGYVSLANLLAAAILRGAYVAVVVYGAVRVLEGLAAVAFETRPLTYLRMVRNHRALLRRRTVLVFQALGGLFWFDLFLGQLQLRTPLLGWGKAVLNATLTIGSLQLSLGHVLAFSLAVWASFLVSRFLRFLLEEDVYERFNLPRGLPYAVSTLLHYLVLVAGFFIGLAALGFDMTKFTILAGAFSVGVGFGLQNIINNFVSGLILLFERPIKVGDVIQVDTATGSVERIGIRASIVRTMDGSEVIIPNGTLISSQVINWTLSDRQRVIVIQINVTREVDPAQATQLLKRIAQEHPRVANHPAPQAYVSTLGAGSLTLELRAWTESYDDWLQIRSDLIGSINQRLTRENIALV
ncbi:MAG: mechanosensitive ion channel [Verrucomicrobia bacterium]|nr:mechanosensitive ion channel [Verrucomicrobiota bacterium]